MEEIMKVLEWLKSKNITSHTVVVAVITMATVLVSDQQVRDIVMSAFQAHPKIGTAIFTVAAIILKYSTSRSNTALVEDAGKVTDAPPSKP